MAEPIDPKTNLSATTTTVGGPRIPTVVVDDVHVIYRVYGAGAGGNGSPVAALKRMLTGTKSAAVREVHAVKGVSFTAYRGEAVGLIGSNGSGKSTLLRAIAGLLPASRGAVYTQGQPSLLGVNAALLNDLSGERNVALGCLAMGMSPAQVKQVTPDIVKFSGINDRGDFSSLPMRTYSSGMAARLRFSIAAAKKHDVLLIDEALATGDARFRRRSEQRVRELRAEAGTVFLVSHSIDTIRTTCERSIWLESGVIRADGPTDEVVPEYEKYMNRT
ncbi:ABC transporter ATP-binding protein [Plantactinospora veratri]|uniref:ABC transporter ATP-binding protein n=1 Tax=Plantactinospora veratri TaxID=1436122 RepID=UPI0038B490FB